jgi:hypothetical protein
LNTYLVLGTFKRQFLSDWNTQEGITAISAVLRTVLRVLIGENNRRMFFNNSRKAMNSPGRILSFVLLSVLCFADGVLAGEECTTAVVTGQATQDGRPILWKNRDTDILSNKVVFVDEKPFHYLAVIDAGDTSGRVAWGGLNEAGFAIINSVSYNLPNRGGEMADLEGMVMGDALRSCATVGDFERYLKANLGSHLGCRTNFCVIDAKGGASIFEVHNHGYSRLDADTASRRCLLNTNFSRTGTPDDGAGYLRFDRESELFAGVPAGEMTHEFVLQTAARDIGHSLLQNPERQTWKRLSADRPSWVHTNHTIDRASTASTILIHGVRPGEDPRTATLWVILGEPLCSIAVPLWVAAGQTPAELREGQYAPIATESARLKDILRPLKGSDRREYLDLTKLDNERGTGWLPSTLPVEQEILHSTRAILENGPAPSELAVFEKEAAGKALKTLKMIR